MQRTEPAQEIREDREQGSRLGDPGTGLAEQEPVGNGRNKQFSRIEGHGLVAPVERWKWRKIMTNARLI
jgi:hypothetical protein